MYAARYFIYHTPHLSWKLQHGESENSSSKEIRVALEMRSGQCQDSRWQQESDSIQDRQAQTDVPLALK